MSTLSKQELAEIAKKFVYADTWLDKNYIIATNFEALRAYEPYEDFFEFVTDFSSGLGFERDHLYVQSMKSCVFLARFADMEALNAQALQFAMERRVLDFFPKEIQERKNRGNSGADLYKGGKDAKQTFDKEFITQATYLEGSPPNPRFSKSSQSVSLYAYPDYMTIESAYENELIVTIPWNNIDKVRREIMNKSGAAAAGAALSQLFGIGRVASVGDPFHQGVKIIYWDEEYQRNLDVYLKTGGKRRAEDLVNILWSFIDNNTTRTGRAGKVR